MRSHVFGLAVALVSLLASGCARDRVVYVTPNTEPPGASIFELGFTPEASATFPTYCHVLTEEEQRSRTVRLPPLVFQLPGYQPYVWRPTPVSMDSNLWKSGPHWSNKDKVYLEKDPSYIGPTVSNLIRLTVNSEPAGARVYQKGSYCGTTPLTLDYKIGNDSYRFGRFRCEPLIAVHDACLPVQQDLEFQVDPDWRYQSGQVHEYATLFLLRTDPDYRPPVVIEQGGSTGGGESTINLRVKQDKDILDYLQQTGQIIGIYKSLRPIR